LSEEVDDESCTVWRWLGPEVLPLWILGVGYSLHFDGLSLLEHLESRVGIPYNEVTPQSNRMLNMCIQESG